MDATMQRHMNSKWCVPYESFVMQSDRDRSNIQSPNIQSYHGPNIQSYQSHNSQNPNSSGMDVQVESVNPNVEGYVETIQVCKTVVKRWYILH